MPILTLIEMTIKPLKSNILVKLKTLIEPKLIQAPDGGDKSPFLPYGEVIDIGPEVSKNIVIGDKILVTPNNLTGYIHPDHPGDKDKLLFLCPEQAINGKYVGELNQKTIKEK